MSKFNSVAALAVAHVQSFEFELAQETEAASQRSGLVADYGPSLAELLEHEGGYTNHPADPGGPTNFGITIFDYRKYVNASGTAADVKAMTVDTAKKIYKPKYWDAMRCDELPAGVDYAVFDYGVNSGTGRAPKVLQRCLGLNDDGKIGDATIKAATATDRVKLVNDICDERLAFLKRLKTWGTFGAGWGRRVSEVRTLAMKLAKEAPKATPPVVTLPDGLIGLILSLLRALLGLFKGATKAPKGPPSFVGQVEASMVRKGYKLFKGPGEVNIAYVTGSNVDGTPNDNAPDKYNDVRMAFTYENGKPTLKGAWACTTAPGRYYTEERHLNSQGAANLKPGQYTAWQVGIHNGYCEALCQLGGPVTVTRDGNEDYSPVGDPLDTGWFGINQHDGRDGPVSSIGAHSAGCLVVRSIKEHAAFMAIVKSDPRYVASHKFTFTSALLLSSDLKG